MRQSEFKKKYDPNTGKYIRQHIFGEGISDKVRSFGTKVFGKKANKKHVEFCQPQKPSKKAGDKILKMLSKPPAKKTTTTTPKMFKPPVKKTTTTTPKK